eukprot:gene12228-5814_t
MNKAFMKHLESEYNTEPFEFVLKVKQFEATNDEKLKLDVFFEIYDTYIVKNAPKEINLSAENLENFRKIIHSQLLHDVFPRFIRTELCIKTIRQLETDSTVFEKREVYDFPYQDEDFNIDIVTDIDVEFMNRLMKDGYDWELIFSDKKLQMNSFYLKMDYLTNVSFFKNSNIQKYESIIPFGLQHCIEALAPISQLKKYDKAVQHLECTSYFSGEESMSKYPDKISTKRSNACYEALLKMPVPGFKFRRGTEVCTTFFDKKGNWVRIVKPMIPSFIKEPKDWERVHKDQNMEFYAMPNFMRFQLTPISENKT